MPDALRKRKLSAELRNEVLLLIAIGYNARIIRDIIEEEHEVSVSTQNILVNYIHNPKYKERIKELRAKLDEDVLKHPLAQKRARLDILSRAIKEALTWRTDKINYDMFGRELSRIEKRRVGLVASLLKEARAEVEGEKPLVEQHFHLTVEKLHEDAKKESRLTPRQEKIVPVIGDNSDGNGNGHEKGPDNGNGNGSRIKIL